jgi:hypothetical protein
MTEIKTYPSRLDSVTRIIAGIIHNLSNIKAIPPQKTSSTQTERLNRAQAKLDQLK